MQPRTPRRTLWTSLKTRLAQSRPGRARTRLVVEPLESRQLLSFQFGGGGVWTDRGPGPIANGQSGTSGGAYDDEVVGAVEALAPHPTNQNILYAGTVNGGVWETTDAYDGDPRWTPLTDQFPSLSIGSLAFSPMDQTDSTLFAGIARTSNWGLNGGPLTGILRTTNGGASWQQLATQGPAALAPAGQPQPSGGLFGLNVLSIVPTTLGGDPAHQVVLAGTDGGIFRSTDGGATFQPVPVLASADGGATFQLVPAGTTTQIIADPADDNRFYAGVAGMGVFRSEDGGVTWNQLFGLNNDHTNIATCIRIQFAIYNSATQNFLFTAIVGSNGKLSDVFRSGDQGNSWTVMGDSGFGDTNPPDIHQGGQGSINLSLTVNPSDPNDVYVGGDRLGAGSGFIGHIEEWDGSWEQITGLDDGPHADTRAMTFDAGGQLLECDDGGIYRRVDHDDWFAVIGNLRCTQFLSIGYDAINDKVFGGTQDTARTEEQTPNGYLQTWDTWGSGDGGNVAYGFITEDGQRKVIRYGMDQSLGGDNLHRKVYSAGNHVDEDEESELNNLDSVDSNTSAFQLYPLAVNRFDGNRIVLGGHSLYESTNRGDDLTTLLTGTAGTGTGNTLAVVCGGSFNSVANPDVVYASFANSTLAADGNAHLYLRNSAGVSLAQIPDPAPGFAANRIVLDPNDWHRVYATDGSQIFYTPDAGADWTQIPVNLLGFNVNIHAMDVFSPTGTPGDEVLLIGVDTGVFRCANPHAAAPTWHEVGANLPHAPVWDLHYVPEADACAPGAGAPAPRRVGESLLRALVTSACAQVERTEASSGVS